MAEGKINVPCRWKKLVSANSTYMVGITERVIIIPNISGYDQYLVILGPYVNEDVGDFKNYRHSIIIPAIDQGFWFHIMSYPNGQNYAVGKVILYPGSIAFSEVRVSGSVNGITYEIYGLK